MYLQFYVKGIYKQPIKTLQSNTFYEHLQDWFKLKPLQVDEGGRVSISTQNLQVEADYQKYGIGEEDVIFHVVIQPTHGVIDLSNWDRSEVKQFSLSDINNDRV